MLIVSLFHIIKLCFQLTSLKWAILAHCWAYGWWSTGHISATRGLHEGFEPVLKLHWRKKLISALVLPRACLQKSHQYGFAHACRPRQDASIPALWGPLFWALGPVTRWISGTTGMVMRALLSLVFWSDQGTQPGIRHVEVGQRGSEIRHQAQIWAEKWEKIVPFWGTWLAVYRPYLSNQRLA